MKKSVIFLINGLGIEKPGSYSIAIDQCMPKLSRAKETSYYTSAIVNSLEYRSAYQHFFLGDTYKKELSFIKEQVLNENLSTNSVYQSLVQSISVPNSKLHIFIEPTNDKIIESINELINNIQLDPKKEIYLHLLLPQQTTNDYDGLISTINFTKYRSNSHISVGFVMGKEYLSNELTRDEMDIMKKLLFFCSAERWSETDKKLLSLKESNIRPCVAPGFCTTNACTINNGDTIMFYNTKRDNYDNIIKAILQNAPEVYKTEDFKLPIFSMLKLDSQFNIPSFIDNIVYEGCLSNMLQKNGKKALIISDSMNINYINFLVNGFNHSNNPDIQFMDSNYDSFKSQEVVTNIIDNSVYDLIIFDYHMDVSRTVNDLKEQLTIIDNILGFVVEACVNKHSLFITSLYGLKKELPLADYNTELVTINYEMQIPIFFCDYSYPRSKYTLAPGYTYDILLSALKCICPDSDFDSLIRLKGILNNIFASFKKNK